MLDQMNDAAGVVKIDQIDREKHAKCMDAGGRNQPDTVFRCKFDTPKKAPESATHGVGHNHI